MERNIEEAKQILYKTISEGAAMEIPVKRPLIFGKVDKEGIHKY